MGHAVSETWKVYVLLVSTLYLTLFTFKNLTENCEYMLLHLGNKRKIFLLKFNHKTNCKFGPKWKWDYNFFCMLKAVRREWSKLTNHSFCQCLLWPGLPFPWWVSNIKHWNWSFSKEKKKKMATIRVPVLPFIILLFVKRGQIRSLGFQIGFTHLLSRTSSQQEWRALIWNPSLWLSLPGMFCEHAHTYHNSHMPSEYT